MRIVCPNCDTAYDVPASVVSVGRLMRCAKCRSEWMPLAPAEDAAVPTIATQPDPVPAPERDVHDAPAVSQADDDLVQEPILQEQMPADSERLAPEPVIRAPFPELPLAHQPVRRAVVASWVASLLVLVIAFWLAIAFRQAVMQHWPASERAYAMLGLR